MHLFNPNRYLANRYLVLFPIPYGPSNLGSDNVFLTKVPGRLFKFLKNKCLQCLQMTFKIILNGLTT